MQSVENVSYPYEKWVDPLDPRLLKLLDGVKVYKTITWNGTPLTTLSQRFYGTTSLHFIFLMFNGFIHPQEIPMGTTLKVPTLNTQNINPKPRKSQVLTGV